MKALHRLPSRANACRAVQSVAASARMLHSDTRGPVRHYIDPRSRLSRGSDRTRQWSEPQLVARLLECFPAGKAWVPVSRWMHDMPAELQEALVPYGGLSQFASAQTNFFLVRKENGVNVVSLSSMGADLCYEREKQTKQAQRRVERRPVQGGGGGGGAHTRSRSGRS